VDRLGGGASHDLDVAVVKVDGQDGVGDGHADGPVLMQATEGDFLAGTMMTPVWEARRCIPTGSTDGCGGGPEGRTRRPARNRPWPDAPN
jgi:hypothetical protein